MPQGRATPPACRVWDLATVSLASLLVLGATATWAHHAQSF